MLHSYWTLLPDRRALSRLPTRLEGLLPAAILRHPLEFLPKGKVHTLIGPLLFQKLATRSRSTPLSQSGELMTWTIFDRWVARQLPRLRPKLVVGYEMCCAETFRVAKSLGITCVLDAAAFHHTLQDEILDEDRYAARTWAGKRLRRIKQAEVELANQIICVSEIAARSYIDAGVDANRVVVNQVGCDVQRFAPGSGPAPSGAPKFIFVGMPIHRKGFDLVVKSFARVRVEYPDAELHVVGDAAMAKDLVDDKNIQAHGKLSHEQLGELLSRVDCLVLPSRLESFGMVTVEALAAGVPAIVSDHAGSSEAIKEDENGWVVPAGDESALYERMLACCRDIDHVRAMRAMCTRSAADYDWAHYSRRTLEIFGPLLERT